MDRHMTAAAQSLLRMPFEVRLSTKYVPAAEGRALIMGVADSDTMVPIAVVDNSRDGVESVRLEAPAVAAFIVRAVNSHLAMKEALEAWRALDSEPFHFDDRRYLDLAAKARALTDAALAAMETKP